MLPTMYVPFADQLGNPKSLRGARQGSVQRSLSHAFQNEVLECGEEDFLKCNRRFQRALGTFAKGGGVETDEAHRLAWAILRDDVLPLAWAGLAAIGDQPGGEEWKSPAACLLGVTLHVLGQVIAEQAFLFDEDDSDEVASADASAASVDNVPDDAPDGGSEYEATVDVPSDRGGSKPVDARLRNAAVDGTTAAQAPTVDADQSLAGMGLDPGRIGRSAVHLSSVRVRLARALRYLCLDACWKASPEADVKELEAVIRGPEARPWELVAQVALEALPGALGAGTISWQAQQVQGKTQKILVIDDELRNRLITFLRNLPLTLTLQPLTIAPQYLACGGASNAPGEAAAGREVSLLGFRRMNKPLRQFLELLHPDRLHSVMSAINAQQRVAWRLNQRVLDCARILARLGLPEDAAGDAPGLVPDQLRVWRDWIAAHMYAPQGAGGRRKILPGEFLHNPLVTSVLEAAFDDCGNPVPFYLPWKADYRGRIYAETPWFTPQGGDLQRALLEFADGEVLDESGLEALHRHGGGLVRKTVLLADLIITDRNVVTLDERELWVKRHWDDILASAADPLRQTFWREVADSKKAWQFLAFCCACADAESGKPCHAPVQIDGTCNGLQHIAALTGNAKLAAEVNVCSTAPPAGFTVTGTPPGDIYARIADCARTDFPDWLQGECSNLASSFDRHECLYQDAARCFTPEIAGVILSDTRAPYNDGTIRSACAAICANQPEPEAAADALARELVALLRKARKSAKLPDGGVVGPVDLASLALRRCKADMLEQRARLLGAELLNANPLADKPKRYMALLGRNAAKKIVMTIPYGASASSQADSIARELKSDDLMLSEDEVAALTRWHERMHDGTSGKRRPTFDANKLAREFLAETIVHLMRAAIDKEFPEIHGFAHLLAKIASSVHPLPLLWVSPIGLPVFQDGFKLKKRGTRSARIAPNDRVAIHFVVLLDTVDRVGQQQKLLPNLIHSLDASHLLATLNALCDASITRFGSIHDCLLIHPNDATRAGAIVRAQFAKLYEHEPGAVPAVYRDWLGWMQLLSEAAAYPERVTKLKPCLLERLQSQDQDAAAVLFCRGGTLGAAITSQPAQVAENARKEALPKLADFIDSLGCTPLTSPQVNRLKWLAFILQCGQPGVSKAKWPEASRVGDPVFDIHAVLQSPYFFN